MSLFGPDIPDEPLETTWTPRSMTEIPAEMIISLAQGLEEPDVVAARHGFSGSRWEKLKAYKPFTTAVEVKKAELAKSGWVFRQKAAMGAEMLTEQIIVQSMSHDVGLMQKLETLKTLAKLGNLEPKEDKAASAGAGFSIQINLPGQSIAIGASAAPVTLDVPAVEVTEDVKQVGGGA